MAEIKVIRPPTFEDFNEPSVFLAGPIQGAPDWQSEAIDLFGKLSKYDLILSSPRRNDNSWEFDYETQVNWETEYLNKAGNLGVVMFWCANELNHYCTRPYAQTTRVELGEWLTRSEIFYDRVVVGLDLNFTGSRYIKHRLAHGYYPYVILTNSLKETVQKTCDIVEELNLKNLNGV